MTFDPFYEILDPNVRTMYQTDVLITLVVKETFNDDDNS